MGPIAIAFMISLTEPPCHLTNSDNLSKSGASVSVDYNDGSTITSKTYGVPTNKIGTLWEVFTFTTSGGFVKEKHMSNQDTPGNIP